MNLSDAEAKLLHMLLEELGDHQSNAGSNDCSLDATPENIEICKEMVNEEEDPELQIVGDQILLYDFQITHYFIRKLIKEHNLE